MAAESKITLHPVETKRASEEIYVQIKRMILDGEIRPGDRLPSERKMMEMLQRSRPTIREAMRMLEREGYIKSIPGSSGAVVQECSVDNAVQSLETIIQFQKLTIENIIEFRKVDETVAARLAALRRTEDELLNIEELLRESEQYIDNIPKFIECDVQFHMLVAKASHNEMFSIMLQVCRNIIGESLRETFSKGSEIIKKKRCKNILDSHKSVYECIKNQDGEMAFHKMQLHLEDAEHDLLKSVMN